MERLRNGAASTVVVVDESECVELSSAVAEARPSRGECAHRRTVHPDSAVRVRNDLLRWILGFSSLTRMGWELTNNGRSPSVL